MSKNTDIDAIAQIVSIKSDFSPQARARFDAEYRVISLLAERDGMRQEVAALDKMINKMLRRK